MVIVLLFKVNFCCFQITSLWVSSYCSYAFVCYIFGPPFTFQWAFLLSSTVIFIRVLLSSPGQLLVCVTLQQKQNLRARVAYLHKILVENVMQLVKNGKCLSNNLRNPVATFVKTVQLKDGLHKLIFLRHVFRTCFYFMY